MAVICGFTQYRQCGGCTCVYVCFTFTGLMSSTLRHSPMHGPDLQSQCLHCCTKQDKNSSWLASFLSNIKGEYHQISTFSYVIFKP